MWINAIRLNASGAVLFLGLGAAASGCYIEPTDPPADAADVNVGAPPPAVLDVSPQPTSSTTERAEVCWIRWTRSGGGRDEVISHYGCGGDTHADAPAEPTGNIETSAARAICSEGSVDECELACSGGRLETCVAFAQILRDGARVPSDPSRANGILARACNQGRVDACLQRGVWLQEADPQQAAALFMQACGSTGPNVTTTTACAEWMNLLDTHAYEPHQRDEIAGLSRVCTLERRGELVPGSTLTDGTLTVRYTGGACGRLKDLGMSPSPTLRINGAAATVVVNPAAPKW